MVNLSALRIGLQVVKEQTNSFQKPLLLLTTLAVARMKGHSHNNLNFAVSYWQHIFLIFYGGFVLD